VSLHYLVKCQVSKRDNFCMPECFKDDNASQWKSGKSDTRSLKKPLTDRHLNLHGRLSRGSLPLCKMSSRYDYPISPPQCENAPQVTRLVFFVFPSAYNQDPCTEFHDRYVKSFRARMSFWGSRKQNFTFRPYFPPKRKFLVNFCRDFDNFTSKRP